MMENWKIKIVDSGYKFERDIYIFRRLPNGKAEFLCGDKIETADYGGSIKPSFSLPPEALQEFANALNELGINPRKEFVEGKLEATEKHLADMRTLLKLHSQTQRGDEK